MTEETASEKPEEAAPADKVAPEAGPLVSVTNGPEEEPATNGPEKPTPKVKKGKKSLNGDDVPPVSTRERSSRGAKTKAALQISLSSLKDYDGVQEESKTSVEQNGSAVKRGGRKKKVPITPVCSPIKPSKPGPKCSKLCSKPGPRSLGRYDHEDINLEHRGLDEVPPTAKYDEALKILCDGVDKTKLKVAVPVLDLKAARDPSVQSSFHYAQNHWLTVGQFQGMSNVVTVSYHAPKVTNHHHTKTKNRVIINEAPPKGIRRLQESPPVIAAKAPPTSPVKKTDPDPSKPPPITNYMSVKLEDLMNCLEKMYHNHLPLNAFTSRFPNARAKAMLTLMLDSHRADCESCDKILDEGSVGIFHGNEEKLKMDMAEFGPVIPTSAPVVDLSKYPDNVAEMKKLLVEKDAKIRALEKRLEVLNKDTSTDEVDKLDLVDMLDGVNEPTMDKYGGKFLKTAGYRIIDLRLLRMALEICQTCQHGKMTLTEMSPDVEGNQEDVVTRLAFVCVICGPKAIFPTSPFSKTYPSNYSLNKLLLPLLGPSSYFHLASFLQESPDQPQEVNPAFNAAAKKPQLLVSMDHAYFDFSRPFDPPPPTDPDANLMMTSTVTTVPPNDLKSVTLKLKPVGELKPPPGQAQMPALRPLETENGSSSNGALPGPTENSITKKIRACPELPPGCRITSVTPGTKLVSKHVKYSTVQKTGLAEGCYRVKEPEKVAERILIIRDGDKPGDKLPCVVTELGQDHREINVDGGTSVQHAFKAIMTKASHKGPEVTKKKARKESTEEDETDSSEEDSDDPSWGRSRKRKNKNDTKVKKRRKY